MTVHFVVKFWLYDSYGAKIHNVWVASSATAKKDDDVTQGIAIAEALKILVRNGFSADKLEFVGFENMEGLKGGGVDY